MKTGIETKTYKVPKRLQDSADRLKAALLKKVFPENLTFIEVQPSYIAEEKKWLEWDGRFTLYVKANTHGRDVEKWASKTRRYTITRDIKDAEKIYSRISPWLSHVFLYTEILFIYQATGAIPLHVATGHARKVLLKFGSKWEEKTAAISYVQGLMRKYLERYGKCIFCHHKGLTEVIWGWECHGCNAGIDSSNSVIKMYQPAQKQKKLKTKGIKTR